MYIEDENNYDDNKDDSQNEENYSYEEIENIIENESYSIDIPYKWYQRSIYKSEYRQIEYYCYYDKKETFIDKIKYIIENYDDDDDEFPQFSNKLYVFLKKVKCHELNIFFDVNYINRKLKNIIDKKRELLSNIIQIKDIEKLINFYEKNKVLIKDINSLEYDALTMAIINDFSVDHLKTIINLFSYSILNYEIPKKYFDDAITPAVYSIVLDKYDICNFLISEGADINYGLIDFQDYSNTIIEFLYKHKKISSERIFYIIGTLKEEYHLIDELKIPLIIIKKLMYFRESECLPILLKEYAIYKGFRNQWYKLALRYGNYEIIDYLYTIDNKSAENKTKIILDEIIKNNKENIIYTLIKIINNEELSYYLNEYILKTESNK